MLFSAPGMGVTDNDIARFFRKAELDSRTGCPRWMGAISKAGYGGFRYKGRTIEAHRIAWMIEHGEIPAGLWVPHLCHRRDCVQVGRLALGSPKANTWSMVMEGRQRRTGER